MDCAGFLTSPLQGAPPLIHRGAGHVKTSYFLRTIVSYTSAKFMAQ